MRIVVYGLGYVGLSLAAFLSKEHSVLGVDINEKKINEISAKRAPISSQSLQKRLEEYPFEAVLDPGEKLKEAEIVFFALPTDYQEEKKGFDVSLLLSKMQEVHEANPSALLVVKSTVPVGFCRNAKKLLPKARILFNPEFLREASCFEDMLCPSRIVVGKEAGEEEDAKFLASLLLNLSEKKDVPVVIASTEEAEAIKLFSNAYLALRVAYFNELDTYALSKGLDSKAIIQGVCLDPRIQNQYNNPSFGYGGYCLPKDSKQLLEDYRDIPENLVKAIVESNDTRKKEIARRVLSLRKQENDEIGVYRLGLKQGSSRYEDSPVLDVVDLLKEAGAIVVIYEPFLEGPSVHGVPLCSLEQLKQCPIILANRYDEELDDVKERVFTRDLFSRD